MVKEYGTNRAVAAQVGLESKTRKQFIIFQFQVLISGFMALSTQVALVKPAPPYRAGGVW
jgi:steroid 5-alpha reductase family enzyme